MERQDKEKLMEKPQDEQEKDRREERTREKTKEKRRKENQDCGPPLNHTLAKETWCTTSSLRSF